MPFLGAWAGRGWGAAGGRLRALASVRRSRFLARFRHGPYAGVVMLEATLVVIEFGASWPKWLQPTHGGDLVVVAQHYEGEPRSLVTQVANRLARLETTGWTLGPSILVVNERTDAEAFAARSILARGLLARLTRASGGELVLTLAESAPRRAHQDLLGLAAALEPEALRSNVRLGVRMGREPVLFGSSFSESASAP